MSSDYVTVIETKEPCNKRVRLRNGKLSKTPAKPVYEGEARTIHVPDVDKLHRLLLRLSECESRTCR